MKIKIVRNHRDHPAFPLVLADAKTGEIIENCTGFSIRVSPGDLPTISADFVAEDPSIVEELNGGTFRGLWEHEDG